MMKDLILVLGYGWGCSAVRVVEMWGVRDCKGAGRQALLDDSA